MNYFNTFIENITPWMLDHGIKIVAILITTYILHRFLGALIGRLVRKLVVPNNFLSKQAEEKREDTLIRIFSATASIIIWLVAGLMVLQEFGIAIGPLLAAAGIAGLAFGFGGQYLIRDIISGLFIIMENQYRMGDVVCLGDTCGSVEDITLRMTTLRDMDGTVHHVPHGEIKKVSNLSKYFSRINMNIGVSYGAELDHVASVINRVGEDLINDPEWKDVIREAPTFSRVDEFADSSVIVKIVAETSPGKQWSVAGELRKRLKIAFDKEGIEIPFPQRVVMQPKS